MNIKCIALDLDRTTLNASGRLSDGNYNALCHAIENGVHIVIASGRSFDTLPKTFLCFITMLPLSACIPAVTGRSQKISLYLRHGCCKVLLYQH